MYFISMGLVTLRYVGVCAAALMVGCLNPFFPPTGTPSEPGGTRNSPAGVIKQLIASYERCHAYRFNDLLSDQYRFYISPSFVNEYQYTPGAQSEEFADTAYHYIRGGKYFYWAGDAERKVHQNLFNAAEQIKFTTQPYFSESNFIYIVKVKAETLGTNINTLSGAMAPNIRTTIDTTNVEIRMLSGEIEITLKENQARYIIDVGEQVFILGRDPDNPKLWLIEKWFDLGIASNG
jgi:hypothetical protein